MLGPIFFWLSCAPPIPSSPTTHSHKYLFPLGWLSHFLFVFLSLKHTHTHTHTHTPLSLPHSPTNTTPHHHLHHYFLGKISLEKLLRNLCIFIYKNFFGTFASSHILFEVKISNLFGGFICFC